MSRRCFDTQPEGSLLTRPRSDRWSGTPPCGSEGRNLAIHKFAVHEQQAFVQRDTFVVRDYRRCCAAAVPARRMASKTSAITIASATWPLAKNSRG